MSQLLSEQLLKAAKDSAKKFLTDNSKDVAELGEDVVKAIFAMELNAVLPAIPYVTANMTIDERADVEEILAKRDQAMLIVANAEKEHQDRIAKVRLSAANVVSGLAKSVLSVAAGMALKAVLGL